MTRTLKTSRSPFETVLCANGCGEQIRLVRLLADIPTRTTTYVPLVTGYPTYHGDVPPSHALSAGRKTCRQLRKGETPDPTEVPALIHHAVCAATRRAAPVPDYGDFDHYTDGDD